MKLNHLNFLILILLIVGIQAQAQKLNVDGGFYTINATAPTTSSSTSTSVNLSSLGVYSLSANFHVLPKIEFSPGYTIFYSKIYRGDMGFGPDFSFYYFPLNSGSGVSTINQQISYWEIEKWRPFGGISFHQRQFQSVQSSYSGFGFSGGVELQLNTRTSARALLRSMSLNGPSSAVMTYTDVMLGLQLHFQE